MQYKNDLMGLLFLLILALSGCSSVPKASSSQAAQAKLFTTHPEKANIYIYRSNTEGSSIEIKLEVDGKYVATSVGQTFVKLVVTPGKHRIVSHADNAHRLTLATVKNKNYFIYQEVKVGRLSTRTKLNLVTEEEGQQRVKQCEMISSLATPSKLSMR